MINTLNFNKKIKKFDNIILWGAGPHVELFLKEYSYKKKLFKKPIGILETTRKSKSGSFFLKDLPYLTLKDVHKIGYDKSLIIITAGLIDLHSQIVKNQLYYFNIIHKKSIEYYDHFKNKKNKDKIKKIVKILKDKKSKKIIVKKIQNIIDGIFTDNNLKDNGPYFNNDIVQNPKRENIKNFLYAGAFDGKHIDRFLQNSKNGKVFAFEPSKIMFDKLKKKYSKQTNVILNNSLLYDRKIRLKFNDDQINKGLSASINRKTVFGNSYFVEGFKIDKLINKFKADLIALDVEGSELNAIKGARKYIKKHKPILCICIYHTAKDHHRLVEYMYLKYKNIYNLYIRQHSYISYIETVLYCKPK